MRLHRYTTLIFVAGFIFLFPLLSQAQSGNVDSWISALKKNPNDLDALKKIGAYCFNSGKTDIAVRCWSRVYKLQSSDAQAWYYLGRLLEMKNKKVQALSILRPLRRSRQIISFQGASGGALPTVVA
jgi:tetratricopeptide (TPR) repeat protein